MKFHGRQVRLGDVIGAGNLEAFKTQIVEQEIEGLSRKGHAAQIEWLENRLGIELEAKTNTWAPFIEVSERRNLFTHCDGRVSKQYLEAARKHAFRLPDNIKVGDEVEITADYVEKAFALSLEHGLTIAFLCWLQITKDDAQENLEAVTVLGNTVSGLVEDASAEVAARVFRNLREECRSDAQAQDLMEPARALLASHGLARLTDAE